MKIGKLGEDISTKYLEKHGFCIIERNFHSRYGEIDIICENSDYIVFVEVKTKKSSTYGCASERVDFHKRVKILKTIETYLYNNEVNKQPRIDVIEVILFKNKFQINHIENAFGWEINL